MNGSPNQAADGTAIDLRSVNWIQGMFLTPDHFQRQERYFDSRWLWLARFGFANYGLIGGGPRVESSARGAAGFDPIVEIDSAGGRLSVTVTQCRGITLGGALVEVDSDNSLSAAFDESELEGAADLGIYVLARPHTREADKKTKDPINEDLHTTSRCRYEIQLQPQADEADWCLLLTRIRRERSGLQFEKAPGFIPPCAYMLSHSELMQAFRSLNEKVTALADRYTILHGAIVDYIAVARDRARVPVERDAETLTFVDRMVLALEACAYEVLDPRLSPQRFFQQMTRLVRSSALFLSLSPPTQDYFKELAEIGESEFVQLYRQERVQEISRRWTAHENLRDEVVRLEGAIDRIERLEKALEGKYLDFRISPALERLNFFFDRTGDEPVFYQVVSKSRMPRTDGHDLTFVLANLNARNVEKYRIVLIGDDSARFTASDVLKPELLINFGSGYTGPKKYCESSYQIQGHRNFAVDFEVPDDVAILEDLRVTVKSIQPFRLAILYVRRHLKGLGGPAPGRKEPRLPSGGPPNPSSGPKTPSRGSGKRRIQPSSESPKRS